MAIYPLLIQQFIADFQQKRWAAQPFERALEIVTLHPEQLVPFINALVTELPEGGTFLDDLFSFLPMEDFPQVISHALAEFARSGKNEAAEAVVSFGSLQCLAALHPHLPAIFTLGINERSYYAAWPWREAGDGPLDFLCPIIEDMGRPDATRMRAWEALLQTRHPALLEYALSISSTLPLTQEPPIYFREVGYDLASGQPRTLYPEAVYHLQFSTDYIDNASRPAWLKTTFHPTWNLDAPVSTALSFGGDLSGSKSKTTFCPSCGGVLHHMVTLEPVPHGLGVSELSALTVAVCLSCLGWEQEALFYRHDAAGQPEAIGVSGGGEKPQFPAVPLHPTLVYLVKTPPRWLEQLLSASRRDRRRRLSDERVRVPGAEDGRSRRAREGAPCQDSRFS